MRGIQSPADLGGFVSSVPVGEELAHDVESVIFEPQFNGYKVLDVDFYLANLAERLRRGEAVNIEDTARGGFRSQLKGYNREEVDAFIDQISDRLASL